MNIVSKVAFKSMSRNKTRTIVTMVGIVLAAAMFTAVLGGALTLWDYLVRGAQHVNGDYYIACYYPDQTQMEELKENEEVISLAEYQAMGFVYFDDNQSTITSFVLAAVDQSFFNTMPVRLIEGRLPRSSREILLPETAMGLMKHYGYPWAVGQHVELPVQTSCSFYNYQMVPPQTEERSFSATYTIVGIAEDSFYGAEDTLSLNSILTLADGSQEQAVWSRAYVKTSPASAVMAWENDQYGKNAVRNTELLGLYGVSEYSNYNLMTVGIVAVLLTVVFVCSVSLIYNSFSISVSERTKEYGLLASVGMTGKQLRSLVVTESMLLCLMAIPAGLLLGNGAVILAVKTLGKFIHVQYSYSLSGDVLLEPVLPAYLSLTSALITVFTVLASVAIPAFRASRCSPIAVIHQHAEYRVSNRKRFAALAGGRIAGVPAMLAARYYAVSFRRYLTIVLSLALSVTIFVGASSVSKMLRTTAETIVRTQDFDFYIYGTKEELDEIRSLESVEKSAYSKALSYAVMVDDEDLSEEFVKYWRLKSNIFIGGFPNRIRNIVLLYLEDSVLLEYLKEQGIDYAPYFDGEEPSVLLCQSVFDATYTMDDSTEKKTFPCFAFTHRLNRLDLLPITFHVQKELQDYVEEGYMGYSTADIDGRGTPFVNVGKQRYTLDVSYDAENVVTIDYYACDMSQYMGDNVYAATDTLVTTVSEKVPRVRLGEFVETRPFGVGKGGTYLYSKTAEIDEILLIAPLSAMDEDTIPPSYSKRLGLSVTASDYSALKAYLMDTELEYEDYKGGEERQRSLVQIVDVLSYVFLILVALICVCNIFNTISTNIVLRRRDFGMLRSIGMKRSQLRKMLMMECVGYGVNALLVGLPLGCGVSLLVHGIAQKVVVSAYALPVTAMLIAVGCVFAVVFASMIYAATKLRKDHPIEAIRMENT